MGGGGFRRGTPPHGDSGRRHSPPGHRRSPLPSRGTVHRATVLGLHRLRPARTARNATRRSARRGLLVIGDGAAQPTVQELGTIGRHHLKPIVVLVNNHGYTIERATHGLRAVYNDISRWHWPKLPAAVGVRDPLVLRARSTAGLDRALARAAATPDRLVLIEAFTAKDDIPPAMVRMLINRPDRARWVP
ncbi:thiamine pyrophosphate-dependent enzyme [Streptomyces sp. SudanB182_2057]|uniref:thiamine pyrophosphate-dependent enzyme n=1 Tax=Streptomyces sp. SudanB182_2057 TaxID=3035281 RepID=UPI003F568B7F